MLQVIENFHLVEELETGLREGSLASLRNALELATRLRSSGWHVHLGPARRTLYDRMYDLGRQFLENPAGGLESLFAILDLVDALGLTLDRTRLENLAHPLYRNLKEFENSAHFQGPISLNDALRLLDRLNFSTETIKTKVSPPSPTEKVGQA
jgi:hypothetical protein